MKTHRPGRAVQRVRRARGAWRRSRWWGLFTGFVGAAMVWFAATGLCILANILYWIGAEPRLNPSVLTSGRGKNGMISTARVAADEKHA